MTSDSYLPHDWFPHPLPVNVVIGERTWCYSSYAFLHYHSRQPQGVRVGHDSGLYGGTMFNIGPDGAVEIGNYTTIVGAIICTDSRIVIGDYVFIAHEVVLADSAHARPPASHSGDGGSKVVPPTTITIGDNSWIGTRAVLLAGAHLGQGAIIGAASVVDFEVPDYAIVGGNPARIVGWARPQADEHNRHQE